MLLRKPLYYCKPNPRSFPALFRREERMKYLLSDICRDPGSAVLYHEADSLLIIHAESELNPKRPSLLHRLEGVGRQVQKNLIQSACLSADIVRIPAEVLS